MTQPTQTPPQGWYQQPQAMPPQPPTPKKPFWKKTWFWIVIVAVLVLGGISDLIGKGNPTPAPVATPPPTVATPTSAATTSPPSTPALDTIDLNTTAIVPNVVGMGLADANTALDSLGIFLVTTADVTGQKRSVYDPTNWEVCLQTPAVGTTIHVYTEQLILGVAKQGEQCSAPPSTTAPPSSITATGAHEACDLRADQEFPWGYKIHSIIGVMADQASADGTSWFWKVSIDITNAFGTKRSATLECTVTGTDANPVVSGFVYY